MWVTYLESSSKLCDAAELKVHAFLDAFIVPELIDFLLNVAIAATSSNAIQ